MDSRLTKLLKNKKYENMSIDELIEEYIKQYVDNARKSYEEFIDELLIFLHKFGKDMPQESIEAIILPKLKNLSFAPASSVFIPLMYKKIAQPLKLAVQPNLKAIEAINKKFLWVANNSSERIQAELKRIMTEAYSGKYTQTEFMDILRENFAEYKDMELHKLKAAADYTLRQGRNLAELELGFENDFKYVQVNAVVDSHTTLICLTLNGRIFKLADLKEQYNNILDAKSVEAAKRAATQTYENRGFMEKKPAGNFGIPPYHFGCRSYLTLISETSIKSKRLDEFNREWRINDAMKEKIEELHLYETKYKSVEEMIQKTLNNIKYEGTHKHDDDRKVIFGHNGIMIIMGYNGNIISAYPPSRDVKGFFATVENVYYNNIRKSITEVIKQWLGI